jgi:hypothetical protein
MNKHELSVHKASLLEKRGAIVKAMQKSQTDILVLEGAIAECEFWLTKAASEEAKKEEPVKTGA